MRHKPQQGTLVIPDDTVWIWGRSARPSGAGERAVNALDACPHAAQITVSWQIRGGRLCVLIADNGLAGLRLLPSLLKPFTTSKTVGLGIGLSICVSLMTQMEGALRTASTFTRSACVVLEFNLTDVKMLSNNCSILLIDDDADVLDAYTQLLEQAGYHVSACNNPFDAREQVPKDWPGIVLSDVCMPGCSGIDLMTLFHQDDDLLPILLITGHGDVPMAVEA